MGPVVGMALWKLANKLKKFWVALYEWNKVVFGLTTAWIHQLEEQIEKLENRLM